MRNICRVGTNMAIYGVTIIPHNQKPHIDIEKEMHIKGSGMFTFVARYGDGKIRDLLFLSYNKDSKFLKTMNMVTTRRYKYPLKEAYESYDEKILMKNLKYHLRMEMEVQNTLYGQTTFNVVLKDGIAQ